MPKPPPGWPRGTPPDPDELLAALYLGYGPLVEENIDEAVLALQRGAAKGNQYCQLTLGEFYENGVGVPRDPDRARQLYRQASAGLILASEAAERLKDLER